MTRRNGPVRSGAGWLRLLLGLCALCHLAGAGAATYTFRTDSFGWETAANAVAWDKTCTAYPGDDDKATLTFSGGFKFTFAGTAYSSVRVLSNGALQFGADTGFFRSYTNTTLPAGASGARAGCASGATTLTLMAYWTDLNPGQAGSGNVSWEQKGSAPNRSVVVSWNSVYQYNTSTPYAFQIVLYENGEFKYQYGNSNASGSAATIGVQVSASDYTLYSYNSGYNANGSAIRWFVPSGEPTRIAEYRMDEVAWSGSVGEVGDSSGNAHHGTRVGSANTVAGGQVCRALDVPANTNSATISAVDTSLDVDSGIGNAGTLSFWVRSNAVWSSATAAMLLDATTTASRPFYLMRNGGGALRFALADSAGAALVATTAAQGFAAGAWVHVAVTWRLAAGTGQSTLRVYVNGALAATTPGTTNGSLDPSLASLFVGDNRSSATPTGATANSANGQIDELRISNYELSAAEIALDLTQTHSCAPPLHHVELRHGSGSGVTCSPASLSIVACQDAACASPYTGGVTGALTASGAAMSVNWPNGAGFSIPVGSSSVSASVQVTSVGSVAFGTTSLTPSASNSASCNFGSPACTFTAADAGFVFDVPNHVAEAAQTVSVSAVRKADGAAVCVPAFASVSKAVTLSCAYQNPASGSLPVRAGGIALNAAGSGAAACDAAGRAVSLAFNASGVASASVQYADVGQMQLSARYVGSGSEAGLVMTGSDSFIAAPAAFAFSGVTAGPIKAGTAFAASVTARNSAGAATPNFGREASPQSASLAFTRAQPSGSGASNGGFSGSLGAFSGGVASAATLVWSEVGRGDLTATLASGNYLGSGLTASGTTGSAGAVGRFIPHHFDVVVTPACGSFSYAAQPFGVKLTARNGLATPGTTVNYDGSAATAPNFAQALTLSDAPALGVGSFGSSGAVAASSFAAGSATLSTPAYSFNAKLTAAQMLVVRAIDADGVSSAGFAEGSTALRSGRLRLANGFGSEKTALALAVQAQYWSGNAWVANGADSCTLLPRTAVALSGYLDHKGAAGAGWTTSASAVSISGGNGTLSLAMPSPGATGSVDLALNLGATASDQSCLAVHPAGSGAAVPWLRSQQGSCATTWDRDPAARASFGIYSPESRKTVHVRELF